MSISQTNIVDFISESPEGKIILTISDHYTWDDWKEHVWILQEKLNSYLKFIESGEIFESYPKAKSCEIVIDVVMQSEPVEEAIRILNQFKEIIVKAGFEFNWNVLKSNI